MKEALNLGVSNRGSVRMRRNGEERIAPVALWIVVAIAIALPALFIGGAAWAGDVGYLSVGGEIGYGGYSTNYFMVDGETAYCATPSKGTPSSGTYTMTETRDESLAAALWYGWGGPGFDASMWPSTWYDGTPLDADKYAALTHILVSDCYRGNGNEAYGQCSRVFQAWCQQYVVGYSIDNGSRINGDALGVKLHERGFAAGAAGSWPAGFSAYVIETNWGTQTIATYRYAAPGSIGMYKVSSNEGLVAGNASYCLGGAVYGVYEDEACTNRVSELVTNDDGSAWCEGVPAGSYWIREERAPMGYLVDDTVYAVTVRRGAMVIVEREEGSGEVPEDPICASAGVLIRKDDAETGVAQGAATLEGAKFSVAFYGGNFENADEARDSGDSLREWTVQTDSRGQVCLDDEDGLFVGEDGLEHPYRVGGDAWWTDGDGRIVFPVGTLVVREVEPPRGYLLNDGSNEVVIAVGAANPAGEAAGAEMVQTALFSDQVVRGGVSIEKVDAETRSSASLGAAHLDGATFDVVTTSDTPVCVDGHLYEYGQTVAQLVVKDGKAQTTSSLLPYGTYALEERCAGEGYLVRSAVAFTIDETHRDVRLTGDSALGNQVIRGDLSFVKKDEASNEPMAGVAFRITSTSTGENHVVVSDAEGVVSTATSHVPHTINTNANDKVVEGEDYDPAAGVWFGMTSDATASPRDGLGALPYDTYLVEELSCKGNEGRQLVDPFSVVVGSNGAVVELGEIEDKTATVGTIAHIVSEDGVLSKASEPAEKTRIVDKVRYANVVKGRSYEVSGWLVDATTGVTLISGGAEVRASVVFEADGQFGEVDVVFDFDSSSLDGRSVVVFEQLVCDGRVIAEHQDLLDEGQTVGFEKPEDPPVPEKPDNPEEPDFPETPEEPVDPEIPETSETPKETTATKVAKTGDVTIMWGCALGGISLFCVVLLAVLVVLRGRMRSR